MDIYKSYRIPYKGLKYGVHSYNFRIGTSFFENFEKSSIKESSFSVKVDLDRRDNMIIGHFDGEGTFKAPCDRCQEVVDIPVNFTFQIIFKFGESDVEEDEVIYIGHKEDFIELAELLYDFIHVSIPIQFLRDCQKEGFIYCDKEVLDRLNQGQDESKNVFSFLKELKISKNSDK